MKNLRAIIVDDEDGAREVLSNLLKRFCTNVEVVADCEDLSQAVELIKKHKPDLVFSDIEMPDYAGYEIVNFFKEIDFEIIFVTAYEQYAVRAFEIAAIDYLLKPIAIERLKAAVKRVSEKRNLGQQTDRLAVLSKTLEDQRIRSIVLNDKRVQNIIPVESIIAIEAQESYCIIYADKKYVASKNLKHFESILEGLPEFFRVHKSWLVNKNCVKNYSKSELSIQLSNGLQAKLSKYKKSEFEAAMLADTYKKDDTG